MIDIQARVSDVENVPHIHTRQRTAHSDSIDVAHEEGVDMQVTVSAFAQRRSCDAREGEETRRQSLLSQGDSVHWSSARVSLETFFAGPAEEYGAQ